MSERLSIIIPTELKKKIDRLKIKLHLDQSSLIRIVLEEGIKEKQIEDAIKEYQSGHVSLGRAIELAESDYWTFLNLLHQKRIPLVIDEQDHIAEINQIQSEDYSQYYKKK